MADDKAMQKYFPHFSEVYVSGMHHLVNQKWNEYVNAVQAAMVDAKKGNNRLKGCRTTGPMRYSFVVTVNESVW